MGILSWHVSTAFYFFLIGLLCKNTILDGEYPIYVSVLYYLALIWLVWKYVSSEEIAKVPKTNFNVCVIGAGFSGINMAIKLKQMGVDFRILEKDRDLEGTWWQNQYPGAGCDVPSHFYSLSYELNPWWSRAFSPQAEIQRYLKNVARKYGILDKIEFNRKVDKMTWDAIENKWSIHLDDGEVFTANAITCGVGILNIPHTPDFAGKNVFRGEAFHSAEWKKDFSPGGHKVAVIGTGATAVQLVPSIASKVDHLYVFQRSAPWIFWKPDFAHPRWLQILFWLYPPLMFLYRFVVFCLAEIRFQTVWRLDGALRLNNREEDKLAAAIKSAVKDPDLAEKLRPDYVVGCKRIAPSNVYLPTFNRDNVTLVTDGIERFTEDGIQTRDGTIHHVDTIIYATGFHPSKSFHTFTTIGTDRTKTLQEEWGDTPNAYLGVTCAGYPNLFFLMGPGTGLGHSSVVFMSECTANYALDAIRYLIEKDLKSLDLKPEVNREYQKWVQKTIQNVAFNSPTCTSWYRNAQGVNYTLWPSNLLLFWWKTREIDPNHYNAV